MHKVKNTTNDAVLRQLGDHFIEPLLKVLVDAKIHACQVRDRRALNGLSASHQKNLKTAFAIPVGSGKKKRTFGVRCNAAVKASALAELQGLPGLYRSQVLSLKQGNYSIVPADVPRSVTTLFKDVIYTELLDNFELWKALGVNGFSRNQFHENFMAENNPHACPYCDLDTINSKGSRFVEHFLPKSKFPLLAVEAWNLFSACVACNGPSGKLAGTRAKVTSPYVKEIGVHVDFSFNDLNETLVIAAKHGLHDVDGYLGLLKLPDRYADKNVWRTFKSRRDAITESVGNFRPKDKKELLAYVERQQRASVLTYAVRYWADAFLAP